MGESTPGSEVPVPTHAATPSEAENEIQPARRRCWFGHRWSQRHTVTSGCDSWFNRICLRCGKLRSEDLVPSHTWTVWEPYEFTRPGREDEGISASEIVVTHQRRRCRQCGVLEDRFVRHGPLGPPLPPLEPNEGDTASGGGQDL